MFQYKLQVQLTAGWVGGPVIIVPLRGSILQAETCQILSLAENPRWSPSGGKLGGGIQYFGRCGVGVFKYGDVCERICQNKVKIHSFQLCL